VEHNPFEAPDSRFGLAQEAQPGGLNHAGKGARFGNVLLDGIAINIVAEVARFVTGTSTIGMDPNTVSPDEILSKSLIGGLVGLGAMMLYYIVMEMMFGKTLAKMLTGTRVVTTSGGAPSAGQIIGRSFARLIPFEAFSFLGSNPGGWHDSLSGTAVIKER
jgi:uncharacterized RDD family membrane protein YckC